MHGFEYVLSGSILVNVVSDPYDDVICDFKNH